MRELVEVKCRVIPALPGNMSLAIVKNGAEVKGSTREDLFITQELDEEK